MLGRRGEERGWLVAHDDEPLAPAARERFADLCRRRLQDEPLAYLAGEKEFFGLALQVDGRVLVPRPDTETLVEWALERLHGLGAPRVLDLGTGSGAIALAIQSARPDAAVEAVDRSAEALAVARANAARLGLPVRFRQADWLQGAGRYHLIVSNPPYVRADDEHLPACGTSRVRRWWPARTGWPTCAGSPPPRRRTSNRGLAAAGARLGQAQAVRALLEAAGLADVSSRNDLAGIQRCTGGRRPEL